MGTNDVDVSGAGCGNCSVAVGTVSVVTGVTITGPIFELLDSICCGGGAGKIEVLVKTESAGGVLRPVPVLFGGGG